MSILNYFRKADAVAGNPPLRCKLTFYTRFNFRKLCIRACKLKATTGATFTIEGVSRADFENIFGRCELQRDGYLLNKKSWIVPDLRSAGAHEVVSYHISIAQKRSAALPGLFS